VRKRLSALSLQALIEEATVDAYGKSERHVGFLTILEEHLPVPFTTEMLETPARVDLDDARRDRGGLSHLPDSGR
jgi:hypothetical protein